MATPRSTTNSVRKILEEEFAKTANHVWCPNCKNVDKGTCPLCEGRTWITKEKQAEFYEHEARRKQEGK